MYNLRVKIRISNSHGKHEIFYFCGLFLLIFYLIVYRKSYAAMYIPYMIANMIYLIAGFCLFVSIVLKKYRAKEMILYIEILIIVTIVSYLINNPSLILYGLAIVSSNKIEFEKIKSRVFLYETFCTLLVLTMCMIGVIPNQKFQHGVVDAYGLGFLYYSTVPTICLLMSCIDFSIKRKQQFTWRRIIFWVLINTICYRLTGTRLSFYLFIIEAILIIVFGKYKLIDIKNNKFWRNLSILIFPVGALATFAVTMMYGAGKEWAIMINRILAFRLKYNYQGLMIYGFNWLGNSIEMIGGTELAHGVALSQYFYIDSGYIYWFLAYGVIIFSLVLVAYALVTYYSIITEDSALLVWCIVVAVYSCVNDVLVNIEMNPLLLLLPICVRDISRYYTGRKRR